MGIRHQKTVDVIFLQGLHALDASASPVLGFEVIFAHPLDIPELGQRDNDIFLLHQILCVEVSDVIADLRSAVIPILVTDDQDLLADHSQQKLLVTQDRSQFRDQLHQLFVLCLDLASFQAGQRSQTHIHDRLRLYIIQSELLHQGILRDLYRLGRTDDPDHFIDVVQSDQQSLQDMVSLLRFIQFILRTACDNFLLMLQVIVKHLQDIQNLRFVVDQRQHDNAECVLKLRMQIQFI